MFAGSPREAYLGLAWAIAVTRSYDPGFKAIALLDDQGAEVPIVAELVSYLRGGP